MTKHGLSNRCLARLLSGDDADMKRRENARRQIVKWRNGPAGFSDDTARRLVQAFRQAGVILPERYFMKPERRTWHDEMEERMNAMRQEIDELKKKAQ